jgi:uncharacterized membrane protein SpoIIM required for sporulation
MRETNFINQNKEKWDEFEKILASDKKDPDKLSNLFIQVSDDLSYSRTFYRNRSVRIYLNNLAQRIFSNLYKNKKARSRQFGNFWKDELPQLIWNSRRAFLISFVVFVLSVIIGVFSCRQSPEFPRIILGNDYVQQTLENIQKKDPMAIYKDMHQTSMFFGIALNNLRVSLMIFLLGLFFSIGSVAYIAYNGIMVGTFQYFFYQHGLLAESALTIWLHGTLEISAMVIAGAAGITMGNGLVFPQTYTRTQSFMLSAGRGVKIILGIAPIIVFAAIIESFLTRYTELPNAVRLAVILFSLIFILGYFVWYPWRKSRTGFAKPIREAQLQPNGDMLIQLGEIKSNGDIFKDVFTLFRKRFKQFFYTSLVMAVVYTLAVFFVAPLLRDERYGPSGWFFILHLFDYSTFPLLVFLNTFVLGLFFFLINYQISRETKKGKPEARFSFSYLFRYSWRSFALSAIINAIILIHDGWTVFLLLTGLPFLFLVGAVVNEKARTLKISSIGRMFTLAGTNFWKFVGLFYLLALLVCIFFTVLDSPVTFLYLEVISWNFNLDAHSYHMLTMIFLILTSILALGLVLPIVMAGMSLLYYSLDETRFATVLRTRISTIGSKPQVKK